MTLYGRTWTLAQQQHALRWSMVTWLLWLGLGMPVARMLTGMPANVAWGLAGINVVLMALLLPWLWPAKNGNMLILAGMLILLNLGFSVLTILHGGLDMLLGSIESLLVVNVLYWLMWVIERLPKRQPTEPTDTSRD
jgi:hypothetical protein